MRQDRRSMSVERPSLPLRLGRESFFAAPAGASLALLPLRARPAWTHAVIGGGDAWQNLWNLHHVDRVLRTGGSLWQTDRLWAPEGCSLYAHTLSLTNSLPGALLARATGFFAAYNALVVLAFTLAFASLYRLARPGTPQPSRNGLDPAFPRGALRREPVGGRETLGRRRARGGRARGARVHRLVPRAPRRARGSLLRGPRDRARRTRPAGRP